MRRTIYWTIRTLCFSAALGLVYVGLVFLFLGSAIGPRGDIDYAAFSDAKKHAADIQAVMTQFFGLVPLAAAATLVYWNRRVAAAVALTTVPSAKVDSKFVDGS